ncbi:MAG: ATPase domain-containing protein [Promethearchaeota archaeon]
MKKHAYLVSGAPGTGKTTLGLQFLLQGQKEGEPVLLVTLNETFEQLAANAAGVGLDVGGLDVVDLAPGPDFFAKVETYDIFAPAEVEREPVTKRLVESFEKVKPTRVFVDSITQFRYLAPDHYQFRKQVMSFVDYLKRGGATALFTSEGTTREPDDDLKFWCDGVLELRRDGYETVLEVTKRRGAPFVPGPHSYVVTAGGLHAFPRLVVEEVAAGTCEYGQLTSGIPGLDSLLGGGIERGTVAFFTGPTGVGKTSVVLSFAKSAALGGEACLVYSFEETPQVILTRSRALGMDLQPLVDSGKLALEHVEPLHYSPDQFWAKLRDDVARVDAKVVVIDSTNAYQLAMRGRDLQAHFHSLARALKNACVTTLVVEETGDIAAPLVATRQQVSHSLDTIVFLRYVEREGEIRRVVGVLKKRLSSFEPTLREFEIGPGGIRVGPPVRDLEGVLSGNPQLRKKSRDEM